MGQFSLLLVVVLVFLRFYAFIVAFRAARAYVRQLGIIALTTALTLGALPTVMEFSHTTGSVFPGILGLGFLCATELFLGVITALPAALSLEIWTTAGRVADLSRGAQFGEQLNPALGARVSPMENMALLATLLAMFSLGGYQFVLALLYKTLIAYPPAYFSGVSVFSQFDAMSLLSLSAKVISAGVCIAAPVIVLGLMFDLGAGILTRMLGRINVSFELLPIKLMLGLLVICAVMVSTDLSEGMSLILLANG